MTDEDDCSAADMALFEPVAGSSMNLQCHYNRDKLYTVEHFMSGLAALRDYPAMLIAGMIVGVPPGEPLCNGLGNRIEGCLDLVGMQEVIEGDFLRPACTHPPGCTPGVTCSIQAYPARRFVELAGMFGENAVVQSICGDDFYPAMEALTYRLREVFEVLIFRRTLPIFKDARDPMGCRCFTPCSLIIEMSDDHPCSGLLLPLDLDSDTIPDSTLGEGGARHTLCEIPQAGSVLGDCKLGCGDPGSRHSRDPSREGWWYNPTADPDGDGRTEPRLVDVTRYVAPGDYPVLRIECCYRLCGEERSCGGAFSRDSKCCDEEEFCYRPGDSGAEEGFCLVRRDICEEQGPDLWCPGAGLLADDPLVGGICCLDPEGDGQLDMIDTDGDGILDETMYRCEGGACALRE